MTVIQVRDDDGGLDQDDGSRVVRSAGIQDTD